MPTWQVTLTPIDSGLAERADVLRRELEAADWRGASVRVVVSRRDDDLLPERGRGAVVALGTSAQRQHVMTLAEALDAQGAPLLALLDTVEPDADGTRTRAREVPGAVPGVLVERLDTTVSEIVALLRGLFHRQADLDGLRRDVQLATRCTGGLHGEIARMHEEMQMAAMVQREFLPRETPAVHNVHFATIWRPSSYVSGDIYDVARLDDDHVGLFLADAVGHGVPAALLTMVICRGLVTREAVGRSYRIVPPSEALARLNAEMIRRQSGSPRFATAVYAVLDCRRRVLTLAGAGHPPPILLRADGSMQSLESEGGLLGIFPHERFEQIEVELGVDDALLIYSDGFEQAFPSPGASSGANAIYVDEFRALAGSGPAPVMVEQLTQRLDGACGSLHQADDITLICATANALGRIEPRHAHTMLQPG